MNAPYRAVLAAAALAAALASYGCATVAEGRIAPPVDGEAWIGAGSRSPVVLSKDRWVLMVVFRPGSEACARDLPEIRALRDRFASKGLVVFGVTPADVEDTEAFVETAGVDFPVLADAWHVLNAYGIPEVNENHTYLIDPPGVVVAQSDLPATERILAKYLVR